ncbi:acyltransferase [Xanthocytophaga agilis]|uniref:Acyltransferase n=1 Tax=Xanthocytophaga agilis TaxID=3048010 RepID=A0AAE3R9X2_9BACT|nr:acyltransferase [Xanthocytophaga agilis]MDJ1506369.1 acyltransferase [Xanthocytophaga agilis]
MKTDTLPPSNTSFSDSKSHYEILDALRGVAAIMVVVFHILEAFSFGDHRKQIINHGYLAVDFFFLLSGFVISHAYDDRWNTMTWQDFFKRRLIRLHPMIIMGMIIGVIGFLSYTFPEVYTLSRDVSFGRVMLVMLIGFTLFPLPVSMDIRGWIEMHPLNGPAWSLFFEYIANILYAFLLRKISNTVLAVLVALAGFALVHWAVTGPSGDLIGGWSLDPLQFRIGLTRLLFPFLAGILLARVSKPGYIKNAFVWCSLLLILVLAFPRVGGDRLWLNGIYDSLSVIVVFPVIIYMGASGTIEGKGLLRIGRFLGDISYPIYIIHYPLIYIFTGWVIEDKIPLAEAWPVGLLVLVASLLIAYSSLKWYDIPVRKWLTERFMKKNKKAITNASGLPPTSNQNG